MNAAVVDTESFEYVRKLVLEKSAIALEPNKGYLVDSRLLPLARQAGHDSIGDLVRQLRVKPYGALHSQVVEAMTTNETSFFRDLYPFEALRRDVLPPLLVARANAKTLNIWSAACSTGQEPYTIAMLLRENFPQLKDWRVQIVATDLSTAVLEKAKRGVFTHAEVNRGLPILLLTKYFTKVGLEWQVKPELREMITFRVMNLIDPWPFLPRMDVVMVRNVLIYFNVEAKKQILANVRRVMAPDGTLFLGGAESTLGIDDNFDRVVHEKTSSYRLKQ